MMLFSGLRRHLHTTTTTLTKRPVVLTILDGWGYREDPTDNAVLLGHTPNFDRLYGKHSVRFFFKYNSFLLKQKRRIHHVFVCCPQFGHP